MQIAPRSPFFSQCLTVVLVFITLFSFYRNLFFKNIEAEICEITSDMCEGETNFSSDMCVGGTHFRINEMCSPIHLSFVSSDMCEGETNITSDMCSVGKDKTVTPCIVCTQAIKWRST